MSENAGEQPAAQLRAAVQRWSALDVRERRGDALRRSAVFIATATALGAGSRSLLLPTTEPHFVTGLQNAAGLGLGAALLASVAVVVRIAIRVRPEPRRAAEAMDRRMSADALDGNLAERGAFGEEDGADVITNGWSLLADGGPAAVLAVRHAARAATEAGDRPASARPSQRGRWALGVGIVVLGLFVGALDRGVIGVLLSPPSAEELAAAEALIDAAAPQAHPERSSPAETRAVQVARAVRRGDRGEALRTLNEMARDRRAESRRREASERDLRALSRALGAGSRRSLAARSRPERSTGRRARASAAEEAEALSRLLRRDSAAAPQAQSQAARRRLLERLQRARSEASQQAERAPGDAHARALSRHLERAVQHLQADERRAAGDAMQDAAQALQRREEALAQAAAQAAQEAPVHRQAERMGRALQRARAGRAGQSGRPSERMAGGPTTPMEAPGESGPRTLSSALASRLAALGLAEGSSATGGGRRSNPRAGGTQRGPSVERRSHSRSRVTGNAGEAVAAISGVGAAGDATTAYRDVFPDYGVQVEEALHAEGIPAARRAVVRRYFESIRPPAPLAPTEPAPSEEESP